MQIINKTKNPFYLVMLAIIVLGIFFRFANLDGKVYWHDEVYTNFRAAGYTRVEIDDYLFQNRWVTPEDLQKFQQFKPNSTRQDTIHSLESEDSQHPPFYFLLARFWMQVFGSSLTANRTLPAFLSLLSFPFIYLLAKELFPSSPVPLIATALFAVSPIDIVFAQTARQYGLLTTFIIANSFLLLKAIQFNKYWWLIYSIVNAIALYTHPFFLLTLIAHGVFIGCLWLTKQKSLKTLFYYLGSTALSFLLYLPWLIIIIANYERSAAATNWVNINIGLLNLMKGWLFVFTTIFVDFDLGSNYGENIWFYVTRLPALLLITISLHTLVRQAPLFSSLFILTYIFVPFLILALPDIFLGAYRSIIGRYILNCLPGLQLAAAYFISQLWLQQKFYWKPVLAIVFSLSILSSSLNTLADTSWTKDISYYNLGNVRIINNSNAPLLITDRQEFEKMINVPNMLSMSYVLNPDVKILFLTNPAPENTIQQIINYKNDVFLYQPSEQLVKTLENKTKQKLEFILPPGNLWKLKK